MTFDPWPVPEALSAPAEYPAGTVLYREGQPVGTLYYIVRGRVRLTQAQAGGRQVVLGIRHAGWLIGASAVVLPSHHWATGTVIDACVIQTIQADAFLRLNATDIAVARWVQYIFASDLRAHVIALAAFGGDATARLGWYLADMARTAATRLPDGSALLSDTPTQDELAEAVGISREYVGRLLQKFEADGTLRRDKGRYVIPGGSGLLDLLGRG